MVWLNKRATNRLDGDLVIARKFALQWSGPYLYKSTVNDNLGEIVRQKDGKEAGAPFRVHLSKLRLYREPEAYPGQYTDLFKPGHMGARGDKSTEGGEEEDKLLQLPDVKLDPEQADKMPENHFLGYQLSQEI